MGAVVVLLFLAGNAALRILTVVVELMLILIALGVIVAIGRYLWRRGGAPPS